MLPLPPKNVNRRPGSGCAGVLLIVIGAGFIGVTLQDGLPLGLFHNAYNTVSFLLFAAVGVALIAWGIRALIFLRAFETPEVEVSPRIQSGSAFRFHYAQAARRQIAVRAIDAFFVYREKVHWGDPDSSSQYPFDRLIANQAFPGCVLRQGEKIDLDCAFRVPVGEMGVRNPYMHFREAELVRLWVVRVRVQFGKSSEIWEDYEIEIAVRVEESGEPAENAQEPGLFDVFLLSSPVENTTSIRNALKEVAPQLDQSGVPYAQHSVANVIRERVGEQEADAIAKSLQDAGGIVNIVPTEATWRLPAEDGQAQPADATNLSA